MMTPRSVQVLGHALAYYESIGRGPAVVLLHGNSFSGQVFAPQIENPLGNTNRLVAPDLIGHGASEWAQVPEEAYNLPGYARFLVAFVKALDLEDALFVGWSLGGHIVLEAASQLAMARGFLIYGAPPLGKPPALTEAFFPNPAINAIYEAWPNADKREAFVRGCFSVGYAESPPAYAIYMAQTDPKARTFFPPTIVQAQNYTNERAIIAQLDKPLAILHGEEEQYVRASYFADLDAPTLWNEQVQIIPNAGHALHLEAIHAFNTHLENFLNDVGAR